MNIQLPQSIGIIYLENDPAKIHPDPIGNDEALGFFGDWRPNNNNNNCNQNCTGIPPKFFLNSPPNLSSHLY